MMCVVMSMCVMSVCVMSVCVCVCVCVCVWPVCVHILVQFQDAVTELFK